MALTVEATKMARLILRHRQMEFLVQGIPKANHALQQPSR